MIENLTLEKAMAFAAQTEELGTQFYRRLSERFSDDQEIAQIFATLSEDEVAHQQQFEALIGIVAKMSPEPAQAEDLTYLGVLAQTAFFGGEGALEKQLEKIKSPQDALQRALQLEKDTLGYYAAMKEVLGENDVLNGIINFEKGHVTKLFQYLVTGAKMRGLGDVFNGA